MPLLLYRTGSGAGSYGFRAGVGILLYGERCAGGHGQGGLLQGPFQKDVWLRQYSGKRVDIENTLYADHPGDEGAVFKVYAAEIHAHGEV